MSLPGSQAGSTPLEAWALTLGHWWFLCILLKIVCKENWKCICLLLISSWAQLLNVQEPCPAAVSIWCTISFTTFSFCVGSTYSELYIIRLSTPFSSHYNCQCEPALACVCCHCSWHSWVVCYNTDITLAGWTLNLVVRGFIPHFPHSIPSLAFSLSPQRYSTKWDN